MKKTIRVTAKKVDDAISQGLEILGVSIVDAEVRVISEGGLFKKAEIEISVGADDEPAQKQGAPAEEKPAVTVSAVVPPAQGTQKKEKPPKNDKKQEQKTTEQAAQPEQPARSVRTEGEKPPRGDRNSGERRQNPPKHFEKKPVREPRESIPASPQQQAAADAFLTKILSFAGIEGTVNSDTKGGLAISIETADSVVIGHRGETLDALQYLVSQTVNAGAGAYVAVTVDAMGYRLRRSETLRRMAQKAAEKCIAQNRRVSLDSMNNSDRKEIHAYLSENEKVVTRSEGSEPNRRVVIYPAN